MLILHSILMRFTFTRAFVRLRWRNNTYSCLLICWAMCLATLPVRSNAGTISNLVHNHSYMMMRLSPEEQLNFVAQSAFKELIQFLQTLKQQHNKLLLSLPRHSLPLSAFQLIPPRQSTGLLFNLPSLDLTRGRPLLLPHDLLPISAKSSSYSEPDVRMTAPEMITLRGFDVELHRVVTEDCYVLTLHRIVHPNLSDNERRRPILLQHGLMGTSADFLMNSIGGRIDDSDNRSLAFHLAKLGYDVWLANSRGNTYSLNHTHMDSNRDKKYWQFSFDEMSKFDLPATIAHIQNQTGRDTIGYVGHSQGTLIMFQLLATRPDLSPLIQPFIALAPVFQLNHVKTPLRFLANGNQLHRYFLKNYDSFLNLKNSRFSQLMIDFLCRDRIDYFCKNILFLMGGFDPLLLNSTRLPVYLNNFPAGTSTHNILHYGQIIRDQKALWFNYENPQDNFACYGQDIPPEIDLKRITSPHITLISSKNDWLSDQEDVNFIRNNLKVKFRDFVIPFKDWNHFDFIIGLEADKYVNNLVADVLRDYETVKVSPKVRNVRTSETESAVIQFEKGFKLRRFDQNTCDVNAKCYLTN